ncbi:hypothetical protein LOX60_03080 [Latilactobacillus curvatus]|uniref:glycerophosphodiester phosphodiesterase n=1 Tax=Latilactobacillus curvatus TaxID=28038 RepID=UPI0020C777E8|nr:glycerophosphodiester phosphodiesterase family protein [Latilactobacillus curvatus]MCP8847902.1 hypothetical protein [Latilactobacillus curvatus]MCP8864637.1 hypothetical protein [Latilactobacillus curvatus]MCP8873454.1 hypothetical protein [Latilactobacillus curvatus]MCP8875247.1 hypothetical protein [Latilactobacillus curvatus]MCP8878897.1 hypothetical protein [Latilactobacillus curvatus]
MGGELGKPLISANFPVLINGDYPSDHDRWAKIVPSPTFKPDYNDSTHVFDFNSQKRLTLKNSYEPKVFLLLKDSKGVVMEDNVTVINTVAESGASTYARLIYSESDNSFKFQRIDAPLKFNDYTIAIIRDNSTDKNASTRQAIITSPSEITINGLPNSTYEEDTYANVIAINHRGASDFAPENTMPAFKMSKKLGFKYVETDIHFTSDNIPVLIHDETINRTAVNDDGTAITDTIKVADNTLATLNMYDYSLIEKRRVDAYIGTKMATLEDLLKYGKRANLKLVLELKIDLSDAQIDTVMGLVWKYGMQRNIIWQSFEASRFNHLKALDPKAKLAFLFGKETTADDNLAKMLPYRNDTNEIIASVQAGSNRDDFYKYSKNDIRVFVWTFYADGAVLDWGVNTAVSGIMTQGDIQQGYILSRQ